MGANKSQQNNRQQRNAYRDQYGNVNQEVTFGDTVPDQGYRNHKKGHNQKQRYNNNQMQKHKPNRQQQKQQKQLQKMAKKLPGSALKTSRENKSLSAAFDRSHVYAEGTFRNVFKGVYTEGDRKGQGCVSKEFKDEFTNKGGMQEAFLKHDMEVVEECIKILEAFNARNFIDLHIRVNRPTIWTYTDSNLVSLVEPFVENYEKFNSNSGWVNPNVRSAWGDVMQAVSHFSYHHSNGQHVLCDLQGGMYGNGIILTDPAIISKSRAFGCTDTGQKGIMAFFHYHKCNQYCKPEWLLPHKTHMQPQLMKIRRATVMQRIEQAPGPKMSIQMATQYRNPADL